MKEKFCRTAQELADETGLSRWTIQAIRKAGREWNDPLATFCTRADLHRWLRRHPTFVARQAFKKKEPQDNGSNLAPAAADRCGGFPGRRAPRTPSPAESAPRLEPAA
jgi:hypothetical protein